MNVISPSVMRGLVLSKFLYKKAKEQSQQKGISSKLSILSFHDAIEIFLYMACIHNGKRRKKDIFYEFWNVLDLTHKIEMERLNKIRNNLKHSAIEPDEKQVENTSNTVFDFFNVNTDPLFGISYSEITMTTLITYPHVRTLMEKSEGLLNKGKFTESVDKTAEAFHRIFYIEENWIREMLNMRREGREFLSRGKFREELEKDEEYAINLLPIDKRLFPLYKQVVFNTLQLNDGRIIIERIDHPISEKEANCCFDFVMDVILSIQA